MGKEDRMTPREEFINALTLGPPGERCPTFEICFFLTMEALGKVCSIHRNLSLWDEMSENERRLHILDVAQTHIDVARKYDHSAIFVLGVAGPDNSEWRVAEAIRELSGDAFFLARHGDPTFAIPDGTRMMDFSCRMVDDPQGLHREAAEAVDGLLARSEKERDAGVWDGFILCSDYCFNSGPFMSPAQFSEFVTPYLARVVEGYRRQGYYVVKHTDGNIMPILDQLVQCRPHALHSLDPQGGVDIAEVKRRCGRELCLIGNVHCGLLQTGTEDECAESARYALRHGMPGGGYIFSTSNSIYIGMPLERYELMHRIWKEEGRYT